ncbi:helix-turn-helix domain-containing protein [Aquimarina sp. 2201CG14-23]|uniref:helix-turn-helix domain-containing protein n=1 Tax=Aquimarina mycalae TaxID=3040073 RepID=UPI002477F71D|nr:helix-turn-helix domain-containing protein [Aquimarina sp. 2201CG14-23]MDH7446259.1 helix-turn-helix domain-containing protein [Aquimarina sp. 2201CG14-23]
MKVNPYNTVIFIGCLVLVILALWRLVKHWKKGKTFRYFYGFFITANLVIIQVLLMDFGLHKQYPWILVLFIPFQYLSPVYFTAFICYYLKKEEIYKRNRIYLFFPFIGFFALYTILKINIFLDYAWISKEIFTIIHTEIDENSAVTFSIVLSICNLVIIRKYEHAIGKLSFTEVKKKTQWIKTIVAVFITFNVIWLLTIILFFIREDISGHFPYYPYWIMYMVFYFTFLFLGSKHLNDVSMKNKTEEEEVQKAIQNFRMSGLNHMFSEEELELIHYDKPSQITGILSYFSTSLFDKNKLEDVLWDIVENCISYLQLEDCVIYILDVSKKVLIQKAAYGNKDGGGRSILSPIEISLGEGIVGQVALSGAYECVYNVTYDNRYVVDDIYRRSELAVPIIVDDKVVGVLDSEHSQEGFFNENHIILFQLIAKLTSKKLAQINVKNTTNITDDNMYFKELNFLMKEAKIYRDASLGLEGISKMLKISSNYLSQMVNKLSGANFSDYVNSFRVEDAKSKLKDPNFANYTVLAIALESGFNSKSTFYNAFKKHTGISPNEYRETSLELK